MSAAPQMKNPGVSAPGHIKTNALGGVIGLTINATDRTNSQGCEVRA